MKCNVNLVEIKENILTKFEKMSNWDKMKRVMALVLKFKMKLKQKLNGSGNMETEPSLVTDNLLNINELDLAQRQLLKLVQNQELKCSTRKETYQEQQDLWVRSMC